MERFDYIPEGQTVVFEAPQRYGKTMAMVAMAYDEYKKGRPIFSNIQVTFPHNRLEFQDITLEEGERSTFYGGHIMIDEGNFLFDCRNSATGVNKKFGDFLLQQKKQGCNVTLTTHSLWYLDKRLREHYDWLVRPEAIPAYPDTPQVLALEVLPGPLQGGHDERTWYLPTAPYMGMYDSKAVYDPFKNMKKPKRGGRAGQFRSLAQIE